MIRQAERGQKHTAAGGPRLRAHRKIMIGEGALTNGGSLMPKQVTIVLKEALNGLGAVRPERSRLVTIGASGLHPT